MVGLLRLTTNAFGAQLGTALVYTLGATLLFAVHRPAPLREIPRAYLAAGGGLFVSYEAIFALAIGLASTESQTIEVSMLNYLWPTLTVVFWAIAQRRPGAGIASVFAIAPGAVLATVGVALTVGGEEILRSGGLFGEVASNPLPYALAFTAAILWGLYNNVGPALSNGRDATAYFFAAIAIVLWIVFLASGAPMPAHAPDIAQIFPLLATAAAVATGYALWGHGIMRGSMRVLSIASYFAPVLSSAASSILLATMPSPVFWIGAACVAAGSIASWFGSKRI